MSMTVLMNAGPWLPVPPREYGGIEAIVASLATELRARGVRVVLATVGASTLPAERHVSVFEEGQFADIAEPYNVEMGVAHAHMQAVVDEIRRDDEIDLVHDHLEVVGPSVLGALGPGAPPVLQTLHWNLRKHPHFYRRFDGRGRVHFAGVSPRQIELAPPRLRRQTLGVVPLGIPVDEYSTAPAKDGYVLVLARITPDKGQDIALRVCRERGIELVMAGPVGGRSSPAELSANPAGASANRDVAFYQREVEPFEHEGARWIGAVSGAPKLDLIARARALVCPIRWEEPGGTAVIEALASGTPVVGFRRGCLPLLVDHGVTGFLADDETELGDYLDRVDDLDPQACRDAAVRSFSAGRMAERYLDLYEQVLPRAGRVRAS
jgi:glycosyltransferase involved in cell wall biosynthesis